MDLYQFVGAKSETGSTSSGQNHNLDDIVTEVEERASINNVDEYIEVLTVIVVTFIPFSCNERLSI